MYGRLRGNVWENQTGALKLFADATYAHTLDIESVHVIGLNIAAQDWCR